jgi:hypothetical protein
LLTLLTELLGKHVHHVPLGYATELPRISRATEQDIDVLFYGSLNPRRAAVLDQLRQAGLAVEFAFNGFVSMSMPWSRKPPRTAAFSA